MLGIPQTQFLLFFCRERKEVKENTTLQTSLSRETQLKIAETVDFQSFSIALEPLPFGFAIYCLLLLASFQERAELERSPWLQNLR